jgi:hypothetical protein
MRFVKRESTPHINPIVAKRLQIYALFNDRRQNMTLIKTGSENMNNTLPWWFICNVPDFLPH